MVTRATTRPHVPPRIGPGKRVTIDYTLRTNGVIRRLRSTQWGDEPLEYVHGGGRLLPALERALEGRAAGDRVVVSLPPQQAYGERDHALQQRVPAWQFEGLGRIEAGMCLRACSEDGRHTENVFIAEVDEAAGSVLIDTNHPLAGMTLEFEVTVLDVRDAASDGRVAPKGQRQARR